MGLDKYQQTRRTTEPPRESEYRLFAQVTAALMRADAENFAGAALIDALDWNRRLWSTLATDCGADSNALPPPLRAQIISLSLWVSRYSSDVAAGRAAIDGLIDINRTIMDGLAARAAA